MMIVCNIVLFLFFLMNPKCILGSQETESNIIFHKEWARYQNVYKPVFREELSSLRHQWDNVFWEPREGRVILFPSWIGHQVEQNLTNVEGEDGYRISISFNINQVIK